MKDVAAPDCFSAKCLKDLYPVALIDYFLSNFNVNVKSLTAKFRITAVRNHLESKNVS